MDGGGGAGEKVADRRHRLSVDLQLHRLRCSSAEPSVALKHLHDPAGLALADVIILPGSKQTADDLHWLRERGFERALQEHARKGGLIAGICGGFQMLGRELHDPLAMERAGSEEGLGLLSVRTIMACDKVTVPARGVLSGGLLFGQPVAPCELCGYEIHLGTTEYLDEAEPFAFITRQGDGEPPLRDGCISLNGRVFGTYLHGIFDRDSFRHEFLRSARASLQMSAPQELVAWNERRGQQLDLLADAFGSALDLEASLNWPACRAARTGREAASMMQPGKFAAAYALDWCVGDPEWLPHPVRLIGWSIAAAERDVRRPVAGSALNWRWRRGCSGRARALCALRYAFLNHLRANHPALEPRRRLWLASSCLGTRNLLDEAAEVIGASRAEI